MTLADLPQVQALSAREKLQLADELWTEAAHHADGIGISAEERQLLEGRWARFLGNPASSLTPEEFEKRLKAKRA